MPVKVLGCRDRRPATLCTSKLSAGLCDTGSGWGCASTCGDCNTTRETSTIPSPRTMWSASHRNEKLAWHLQHRQLVAAAAAYTAYEAGTRLVLIGDSIMEGWRGTRFNRSVVGLRGVAGVFNSTLEGRWPRQPLNFGISGDMSQHVLWRLAPGSELSVHMQQDKQMLMLLLVGTNNLLKGKHTAEETHAGVAEVMSTLLRNTRGRLLVNALFPFAHRHECRPLADSPTCETESTKAIAKVNRLIRRSVSSHQAPMAAGRGRVRFVDCGQELWHLRETHMPDLVHPSLLGYEAWGRCMLPELVTLAQS